MVDKNDQDQIEENNDHRLHARKKVGKTLVLKPNIEAGKVRQNFSHGRTKTVVVEKRKKRNIINPNLAQPAEKSPKLGDSISQQEAVSQIENDINLTDQEREARLKALSIAKIQAEKEATEKKEREKQEAIEAEKRKIEEEKLAKEKSKLDLEKKDKEVKSEQDLLKDGSEAIEAKKAETDSNETTISEPDHDTKSRKVKSKSEDGRLKVEADEFHDESHKSKAKKTKTNIPEKKTSHRPRDPEKRRSKLTITNLFADQQRERSLASLKRKRERQRLKMEGKDVSREKIIRNVVIPEDITIQELANRMSERAVDVIKILMKQGQMHKASDVIDPDTAQIIAEEMGHQVIRVAESDVEDILIMEDTDESLLQPRPPIVAVMGHVDHGKTSLLDAIRKAGVAEGEAGGITQHIGAYQILTDDQQHKITFLDTPGHESFSAIRARGAKVTDIVVLVVAADDGIMPQTIEAINHAKASNVPIIVAINKIDLPAANPSKIRSELLNHEVMLESFGGEVLEVEVSAKNGTNLDKLIDAIMLQGEILELKANPDRQAEGTVIESKLDKGRGAIATVVIQKGTLRVGDIVVAGTSWGRVRALIDEHNQKHDEAPPSKPVEVLGLNNVCAAGDYFAICPTEQQAREIVEYRERKEKINKQVATTVTLDQMFSNLSDSAERKDLPLIIKGDVHGSVEAILGSLEKFNSDEVRAKIVHSAAGGVTDSDVTLAMATGAVILAFNVRANAQTKQLAEREGVEIRYYSIIYNLIDDIKAAMSGMLSPTLKEHFLGNAEVLEVFNITKVGKIAGCRVTEGKLLRKENFRLIRDNVVIYEGELSALKRFKDDAAEVNAGQECGMSFENFQDLKVGDIVECYEIEEIQRSIK